MIIFLLCSITSDTAAPGAHVRRERVGTCQQGCATNGHDIFEMSIYLQICVNFNIGNVFCQVLLNNMLKYA